MVRRSFGQLKKIKRKNGYVYEAKYKTPIEALQDNPQLPEYFTKNVPAEYKAVAEKWLYDAQVSILAGTWTPPARYKHKSLENASITFKEYAEQYVANHRKPDGSELAPTTIAKHKEWLTKYLYPIFGEKDIRFISEQDIKDWWNNFGVDKAGNGAVQRFNTYKLLRSIFRHAATTRLDDTGRTLISSSPCVIQPSRPRKKHESLVAEYDELKILADNMPDYLAISIYLAGVCGLREGEVCALTRKDINLETRQVNISKAVKQVNEFGKKRKLIIGSPKSVNSIRKVPIPQWVMPLLEKHLDSFVEPESDALLIKAPRTRSVLAPQQLRANWYKALKQVPRLEGMHFHDLRHTALTHYGEAGASLAELMEIAGHADIKTVTVYQQISQQQREATAERLNKQARAKREDEPRENNNTDSLLTVLEQLPLEQQASILKALDKMKQAQIISQLPADRQVELLPLLL